MTHSQDKPSLPVGETCHGFRVVDVREVPSVHGLAYLCEHCETGARLLHIHCDDAENLFSINFATPPPDDTGLPHILEHAVLAGSQAFPVREPFFEMIKMSMATFINAMTGWDCTYYPVCSNVPEDLFNLAQVYVDAVFHPLLTENTFRREGHHVGPADEETPPHTLKINGIVYNEMKAAFSRPEGLLHRVVLRGLFPDTPYGRESGGDPDAIPQLTYQDFVDFHRNTYNPTNARFLCYGDISPEKHLEFLEPHLANLSPGPRAPAIPRQPRWSAPRAIEQRYEIGADEGLAAKTFLLSAWVVGGIEDIGEAMDLSVLGTALLGNEAAPLRKALIDSKLGEDVVFAGCSPLGREAAFRVGLRGSEPERMNAFRKVVDDTLRDLADNGIAERHVRAAFQQSAYLFREISSGFPLDVLDRVLDTWLYDLNPLTLLDAADLLDQRRERYEQRPERFQELIRERLLDNPHRLDCVLRPDRSCQTEKERRLAEDLAARRREMTDEEAQRIAEQTAEVEREAETPNTPEQLATLPHLSAADLPRQPREVPRTAHTLPGGGTFIQNHVFANGVNYLRLEFDLSQLPPELWNALPRYVDTVRKLGAGDWDFQEVAWRKAEATGGISVDASLRTALNPAGAPVLGLCISMKALDEQLPQALDVLEAILFEPNPHDRERFRDVIVQSRSRMRSELVRDGLTTARRHATRHLYPECALGQRLRGIPQLRTVERIAEQFDAEFDAMTQQVLRVRDCLLCGGRLSVSFTGSDGSCGHVRERLAAWTQKMPPPPAPPDVADFAPTDSTVYEGLAAAIQVCHCARAFRAPSLDSPDAPLLLLGTQLVNVDYMLSEIRLKGNAYGAGCQYRGLPGHIILYSYADPNSTRTFQVFDGLADYVRSAAWTQTELDRAIISAAKMYQSPVRPEAATTESLEQFRSGLDPERRKDLYQRLLNASVAEVRGAFLNALEQSANRTANCIVASQKRLEETAAELPHDLAIQPILLQEA